MTTGKRKSERSTRSKLCSPGRPPVWQRDSLCRFWLGIAAGLSSEEAGVEAGVSAPVGGRWFRSFGGMPPTHLTPSAPRPQGRNLSFAEREEIALECARKTGVRVIARKMGRSPSTISREIRRNSATRGGDLDYRAITAQWHADCAAQRPKGAKPCPVSAPSPPRASAWHHIPLGAHGLDACPSAGQCLATVHQFRAEERPAARHLGLFRDPRAGCWQAAPADQLLQQIHPAHSPARDPWLPRP